MWEGQTSDGKEGDRGKGSPSPLGTAKRAAGGGLKGVGEKGPQTLLRASKGRP